MQDEKFQISFEQDGVAYEARLRHCYTLSAQEREKLGIPEHGFWVSLYSGGRVLNSFALVMGENASWMALRGDAVDEGMVQLLGEEVKARFS